MTPYTKTAVSGGITRPLRHGPFILCGAALLLLLLGQAWAAATADWKPLTERLTADGFNREAMETLFSRPEVLFEPDSMAGKLRALVRSRSAEPDSLSEAALRKIYRREYLNPWAIGRANSYLIQNKSLLEEITTRYGVPKEIVVSILLIETHLGKNTGNRRVFNRLASMASATALEIIQPHLDVALLTPENEEFVRRRCREKSDWAYGELKALLNYAAQDRIDPLAIRGSIYGAIGLCQFMPSNISTYGVDADGDGRIDPFAKADALHSIANFLRGHGWREGMDRDEQHRVIFAYNHSTVYADTVLAVAEKIRDRDRQGRPLR
ncbi:MAG TPA: murein transglycosylase [Syntrophus sp. (in: bacteria)]|nr:murein transglycosylase [Syntrophus sp. (in: bacteria)]